MKNKSVSEIRKREISELALRLLSENGINRLTTATLSSELGLSEGTIFKYFSNKKEIIDTAILRAEEKMFEDFPPSDPNPIDKLGVFFTNRAYTAIKCPGMVKMIQSEQLAYSASEEGIRRLAKMKAKSVNFIKNTLSDALKMGLLTDEISINALTFIIFSSIASLANIGDGFLSSSDETVESIWTNIKTLISK